MIISRDNAIKNGLTKYFTGHPCTHGHVDYRYVCDRQCAECGRLKVRKLYLKYKDKRNLYNKQYHAAHRDSINARHRKWNSDNPEESRRRVSGYRKSKPEASRNYVRNYQARKKNASGSHTVKEVIDLYARQRGRCYWCSVLLHWKYHVDHVVPVSRGGSNSVENLVVACRECNLKKKDRSVIEFAGRLL